MARWKKDMDLTVILRLAIALAIGLIIGMERVWESRKSSTGSRVAGIRSFGFVGLFGGLSALLAAQVGASVLGIIFLGLALIVAVSYGVTARKTQDFGITTELALVITFLLGALAGKGLTSEAVAAAVVMAVLLGFKQELHQSLQHLDRRELIATLQLLLIAAVVLPLLPDRNLSPWSALNPRAIGLLVVLIAGISYVGYFAIILIAAVVNTIVKAVLATVIGGWKLARWCASILLLALGLSLTTAMFTSF